MAGVQPLAAAALGIGTVVANRFGGVGAPGTGLIVGVRFGGSCFFAGATELAGAKERASLRRSSLLAGSLAGAFFKAVDVDASARFVCCVLRAAGAAATALDGRLTAGGATVSASVGADAR